MDENPYQPPREIEEPRRPQRRWPINPWRNMLEMIPPIIWVLLVLGLVISIVDALGVYWSGRAGK